MDQERRRSPHHSSSTATIRAASASNCNFPNATGHRDLHAAIRCRDEVLCERCGQGRARSRAGDPIDRLDSLVTQIEHSEQMLLSERSARTPRSRSGCAASIEIWSTVHSGKLWQERVSSGFLTTTTAAYPKHRWTTVVVEIPLERG